MIEIEDQIFTRITPSDVNQAYMDALFMCNGNPVMGLGYSSATKLFGYFDIANQERRDVVFEARLFKPLPVDLGYVNIPHVAIYITRKPTRQWSIGIHYGNVDKFSPGLNQAPEFNFRDVAIADAVAGKYPSVAEACKMLRQGGRTSCAVSRSFAITAKGAVYYRTKVVGFVHNFMQGGTEVRMKDKFEHLLSIFGAINHGFDFPNL